MSHFDYELSRQIAAEDHPFHALIMAAARRADTYNYATLKTAFPGTVIELEQRYNAPGGLLEDEREPDQEGR